MQLSQDQEKAVKTIYKWQKTNSSQFITLGGYAGTGKTTLITMFRKLLKLDQAKVKVAFCSFTGKGALVLKNKLKEYGASYSGDSVGTIHSLIYEPIENKNQEIVGWSRKDEIKKDLIIVDEASMVSNEIWLDLISYNLPILAVGDHGQLPPINGNFNLMEKPQVLLEHVHRQVADNPIIKISIMARKEGAIPFGDFSKGVRKLNNQNFETQEFINDILNEYDEDTLVLCGYNNTRNRINAHIRNCMGFESIEPEPGDRVICLRNNHDKQIFNGMLGKISHIEENSDELYYAEIKMESGVNYEGLIYKAQFGSAESINFTKERKRLGAVDLFDYGYGLTVHKAQGSEAKRVVLFEERFAQMDDEMWRRWLYTAVTRAKEELYIVGA